MKNKNKQKFSLINYSFQKIPGERKTIKFIFRSSTIKKKQWFNGCRKRIISIVKPVNDHSLKLCIYCIIRQSLCVTFTLSEKKIETKTSKESMKLKILRQWAHWSQCFYGNGRQLTVHPLHRIHTYIYGNLKCKIIWELSLSYT